MASANVQIRHRIRVTKVADGSAYTGLVNGDFTKTLRRMSGNTFVSASETVTISEINAGTYPGMYLVAYTPTSSSEFYTLDLSGPADSTIDVPSFQDPITGAGALSTGPYLTTRDNYKLTLGISDSNSDAQIDQLLPAVTAAGENYCRRTLIAATVTEYFDGQGVYGYPLKSYPVSGVTSVHVSTGAARVYDATTLLDASVYDYDADSGILHRIDGAPFTPFDRIQGQPKSVKVVSAVGYGTIPPDLELGAIIWIAAMLPRLGDGTGSSFHIASLNRGDGQVTFDTSELLRASIPSATRGLWDPFRVFARAA